MDLSFPLPFATFTKTPVPSSNLFPPKISHPKHKPHSPQSLLIKTNTRVSSSLSTNPTITAPTTSSNYHWIVTVKSPPEGFSTKPQVIDYYVHTLQSVLGSEKEAQMSIYHASLDTHFGFCCDIDEETSLELAGVPSVLSVRPDPQYSSTEKEYSSSKLILDPLPTALAGSAFLFPLGNSKHWLVRLAKPEFVVVSKADMVDHCTEVLSKVMGK